METYKHCSQYGLTVKMGFSTASLFTIFQALEYKKPKAEKTGAAIYRNEKSD